MKGYKALRKSMRSIYGNIVYKLDKEYSIEGELKMCENGYHFCKELINVFTYYPLDSRVFEIDTLDGEIKKDNEFDKYCTNKIKLVREISKEEINEYVKNNLDEFTYNKNWRARLVIAQLGYNLDILINDKNTYIRAEVARQGYGLDTLINDEDFIVRAEVAKQGYGLDKLVNDKDSYVLLYVIEQNYGLDKFINSEDSFIRKSVAKQGYGLDKLINDESCRVRAEVARQGYGLDILINDPDPNVRIIASENL